MNVSIKEYDGLEPYLVSIAAYLIGFSIEHLHPDDRQKARRNAKKFAVWESELFCRVQGGLKLVLF